MSLINQVLQELDARGVNEVAPAQTVHIKLAPEHTSRRAKPILVLLLLASLVAVLVWTMSSLAPAKPDLLTPINSLSSASAASIAPVDPTARIDSAPSWPLSPAAQVQPATLTEVPASTIPPLLSGLKLADALHRLPPEVTSVPAPAIASEKATSTKLLASKMQPSPPDEGKLANKPVLPSNLEIQTQNSNPQQRAENEYRRANQFLQQAKTPEPALAFEQALSHDKHPFASRQSLATLLLANNRNEEALRHLQQGLQLDPGHTVFAMMLARVQAERNELSAAIETMYGHLPIAVANAEFQASLAALLQRDKRHREANEHFLVALQLRPENGVWWMGLGISLQAESRFAQAKDAFTRAKQSRSLNPQLSAFVEQKLTSLEARLQHLAQEVQ